jgi:cyclophilin family peptidyl-prolyl cis-trans isomerase
MVYILEFQRVTYDLTVICCTSRECSIFGQWYFGPQDFKLCFDMLEFHRVIYALMIVDGAPESEVCFDGCSSEFQRIKYTEFKSVKYVLTVVFWSLNV